MGKFDSIQIGDKVTVKKPADVYYSNKKFKAGDIGIVSAVKVPYVTHIKGNSIYFCCVDFVVDGETYRAGVDYNNIVKIKYN